MYDSPGHEGGILNDKKMLINIQSECKNLNKKNFDQDSSLLDNTIF
jgi:hypothetical protein